jgi:peptide/nickel transport system permease protein
MRSASLKLPMGTICLGRDVLSQMFHAIRTTGLIDLVSSLISVLIGANTELLAGY